MRRYLSISLLSVLTLFGLVAGVNSASAADVKTINSVTLNSGSSVTVMSSVLINASVKATVSGGGAAAWKATEYQIGSATPVCRDITDKSNTTYTDSFSIAVPATTGTYDFKITLRNQNDCGGTPMAIYTLTGGIVVDATAPTVTNVTSPLANGSYKAGQVVPIQVVFSEVVNITGTPTLTLQTTSSLSTAINYSSGTGTNTLTFNYTVAPGDTSADLNYHATNSLPNVGTITDVVGNVATRTLPGLTSAGSLGTNKNIVIDTTSPVISLNDTTPDIIYGGSYIELGATAVDAVDGSSAATPSGSVNTSIIGSYIITYNATDTAGNVATPITRTINVIKADQTITVITPAPANAIYNSTFEITATSSSQLPVAITTSGSCSGVGSASATVTMTSGTGTCTVSYNQVGNGNYNSAPEVTENTTATIKSVTVTTDGPKAKVYGDSDPALTYTSSDPTAPFTGTLSRDAGEDIGDYNINQGSLALNGNYSLAFSGSTLTITPFKVIAVTIVAKSKTYGDSDPELTYTFSPALQGSDTFSGSLSRVGGEDVGDYAITHDTLNAGDNYVLSFTGSNLTITAKPITVTADSQTKEGGNADPELTYQITDGSLVEGDSFTGTLTRDVGENVEIYPINQGSLALNGNYNLTFVGNNLSIVDTTAPMVSNLPNLIIEASSSAGTIVSFENPVATDLVDSEVSVVCNPTSGSIFAMGETRVLCTATDDYANQATTSFKINVQDTISPIITLVGSSTISLFVDETYEDLGATATDNIDGDITARITSTSMVSTSVAGAYSVVYLVNDNAGNSAEISRNVFVSNRPPVIIEETQSPHSSGSSGRGSVRSVPIIIPVNETQTNYSPNVLNFLDNSQTTPIVEPVIAPEEVILPTTSVLREVPAEIGLTSEQRTSRIIPSDLRASSTEEINSLYSAAVSSVNLHTFSSWWTGLFAIIDSILIIIYFRKKRI